MLLFSYICIQLSCHIRTEGGSKPDESIANMSSEFTCIYLYLPVFACIYLYLPVITVFAYVLTCIHLSIYFFIIYIFIELYIYTSYTIDIHSFKYLSCV